MNALNPILAFTNTQNIDYYNGVIGSFVFEETEPVVQNGYTYEENGVYYCANATEKEVYHTGSYIPLTDSISAIRFSEIENARGRQCRQAVRTWLCGGISADLIFLLLF